MPPGTIIQQPTVLLRVRLYDRLDRRKEPDRGGFDTGRASVPADGEPRDALVVDPPIWMFGDSACDVFDWHDHLLVAGIVPVVPYNPRNTDDPLDIEYRVEDRIEEDGDDVQFKQFIVNETYNRWTGGERPNDAVKDYGLGHIRARGRVHARTEVFLALCLRLVVAITNYEREDDPGREKLTL